MTDLRIIGKGVRGGRKTHDRGLRAEVEPMVAALDLHHAEEPPRCVVRCRETEVRPGWKRCAGVGLQLRCICTGFDPPSIYRAVSRLTSAFGRPVT